METRKMYERINWFKKEFVYDQYLRIVERTKDYDKISKRKMLDEIYKVYDNYENIIDICTMRELKYLEMILGREKSSVLFDEKYYWERESLTRKFLIQSDYKNSIFIPDEIIDKVKEALDNVDYKIVKRIDDLNEILVSYCKIQGSSLLDVVCSFGETVTGINHDIMLTHVLHNKVFNYYVCVYSKDIEGIGDDIYIALYFDYLGLEDEIDEERKKQGLVGSLEIDLNRYRTLFYNDFDINNKKIVKFLDEIMKLPFFYTSAINIIKDFAVLNRDRSSLKESISNVPSLKDYDLTEFFKIMDDAMDEMPSGVLNGFTPNESKKIKLEEIKKDIDKDRNYVRQVDACLSRKDAKLFYKIYFGLLEFTNNKYKIKNNLKIYNKLGINPYDIKDIVDVFWKNKDVLVLEFCLANPYKFSSEELKIASEFKKGFRDIFIVVKFEEEYTAFMNVNKTYMVKGINDNLDNVISFKQLPYIAMTSIIPFKNVLIYDGMFLEVGIKMGSVFDRIIEKEFASSIRYYHL